MFLSFNIRFLAALSPSNLCSQFHGAKINSQTHEINKSRLPVCSQTSDRFTPQCDWERLL